jgi:hypothetical protein
MTTSKDKSHNDNEPNAAAFADRELSESELEGIAGSGDKHPGRPCDHPDHQPQKPKSP